MQAEDNFFRSIKKDNTAGIPMGIIPAILSFYISYFSIQKTDDYRNIRIKRSAFTI